MITHLGKQATCSIGNNRGRIFTIIYKHYNKLSLLEYKLSSYSVQALCIDHQQLVVK